MIDPAKVRVVCDWVRPTFQTEIQSFIGLPGNNRQFIQSFSSIATPLTKYTQKHVVFLWTDECELRLQKVKELLSSTPILTLPEEVVTFVVFCDVSSVGLRDMKMRQRRWLELLKDYEITILYHSGKANMVADALSWKEPSMGSLVFLKVEERPLALEARSTLMDQIRAHQVEDDNLRAIWYKVLRGEAKSVTFDPEGILRICGRICVPGVGGWVRMILEDAHCSKYSIHPRATKMCHDLKQHYWWCGMKKDIVDFVFKCLNCQQVKYEHQIPGGTIQRMPIPMWKWECITLDILTRLPLTLGEFYSIWVIVDRLTNSSHFIHVKTNYNAEQFSRIYIREFVRLHGLPISIVPDRGAQFTSHFWSHMEDHKGTKLDKGAQFASYFNLIFVLFFLNSSLRHDNPLLLVSVYQFGLPTDGMLVGVIMS
ncbi:hypothetical protein MTR67_052725 [Solanum verrucosum]|uniref:Integrase zinc-binding domain-containing protein n=1 Tax=Solanum verrucosum TaxID=315347 RepID=A0AAF0V7E9_SOLVR|nr:hypothetical protein MTR67_052725 [Solanum verrucosum]